MNNVKRLFDYIEVMPPVEMSDIYMEMRNKPVEGVHEVYSDGKFIGRAVRRADGRTVSFKPAHGFTFEKERKGDGQDE